jgi:hypothetical protein
VYDAFDEAVRTEIKQRHWTALEDELTGTSFVSTVYQRTAETLLDEYVDAVQSGEIEPKRTHLIAVIDRSTADVDGHKYSVDSPSAAPARRRESDGDDHKNSVDS